MRDVSRLALIAVAMFVTACGVTASQQPGQRVPALAARSTPATGAIGFASYFSLENEHPENVVVQSVDAAQSEIVTAMYSFTYQPIWDAYGRAVQRHVAVTLVVDATELSGANNGTMRSGVAALCQLGVKVRKDNRSGLMHLKLSEIDSRLGLGGSYNYTSAATKSNDEILILVDSPKYVSEWRAHILTTYTNAVDACSSNATPAARRSLEGAENGD